MITLKPAQRNGAPSDSPARQNATWKALGFNLGRSSGVRFDEDGTVRVALRGELDLAVVDMLHERLVALKSRALPRRLGLA